MRKKLRSAGGLTLVEMLCAVAILVLLCLMMNTGMQMAVKSYDRLTAESETQLLLGSLSDALIDKLRYAVVTDTDTLSIGDVRLENGRIVVVEKSGTVKQLLPDGAYGTDRWEYDVELVKKEDGSEHQLYEYEDGKFTVHFKIVWTKDESVSAQTPEGGLVIHCLNPVRSEEP